ncbi:MAG: hypothetical protein ACE5GS_12180 [Kiloniellaceae bacterium]
MSESELEEARRKIERLEAELARTTKVQEDLWAHQIYVKARQKMTVGVFAILAILSALGLFTAYEFYKELLAFSADMAEKTIQSEIDAKVDEMVQGAEPKLQARLSEKIETLTRNATNAVQARIDELDKQVSAVAAIAQRADYAAKRLKQITLATTAAEQAEQKVTELGAPDTDCNPLELTDSQKTLIRIKQDSEATGTVARNGFPYFKNTFSVAVHSEDQETISPSLAACVIDAIDRVVYNLSERWFTPSEVVRLDKDNGFRLSRSVWGPLEINVAVYLRGEKDPIPHYGSFMIREHAEQYLETGRRARRELGARPY